MTASVFTPCVPAASTDGSVPDADEHPFRTLLQMYDYFLEQAAGGDDFVVATSASDIEDAREDRRIAIVLGMEGGDPFNDPYCDVAVLRGLYRMGLRHVQLVHDGRNDLGTSTRFYEGPGKTADHLGRVRHDYDPGVDGPGGLTAAGKEFVREMDDLGMVIDVSHMVEAGFWQVLDATDGPVIASHSNARARVDCQRNLSDEQIAALAGRGGVVGVCGKPLCPSDLRTRGLENMVDDIEHIADLVGPEHVGIGTDEGGGNSSMCLPCSAAAMTCSAWGWWGVAITMASMSSRLSIVSKSVMDSTPNSEASPGARVPPVMPTTSTFSLYLMADSV